MDAEAERIGTYSQRSFKHSTLLSSDAINLDVARQPIFYLE